MDAARIYGRGFRFPFGLTERGQVAWSEGEDNVQECLQHLLLTELGERLHLPDFGGGLSEFLYEPNAVSTRTRVSDRVKEAVNRGERRVRVRSVEVLPDPTDPAAVIVTLSYDLVATQIPGTLQLGVRLQG